MIVELLLVLGGLALLVLGGDLLVKGAVGLSLKLGMTPLVVGLTVVAFGTSAPELLVSLSAALKGSSGIAMGNVVGSNIANVLVILGVTALVSVIVTKGHDLRESWGMMIAASLLLIGIALTGEIGRLEGVILLLALAAVLWRQLSTGRAEDTQADGVDGATLGAGWGRIAVWLGLGLVLAVALPLLPRLPAGLSLAAVSAAMIAWHLPGVYDAIWASDTLYWVMQAAMLLPAWVFWSAVLAPGFGAEEAMRRAVLIGGLAGIMGFLGAILTFAPDILYFPHVGGAMAWGMSPLADQQLAGLIMWVPGFVPVAAIAGRMVWHAWRRGFAA